MTFNIVARQAGQSISETAELVGFTLTSISEVYRKECNALKMLEKNREAGLS